MNRTWIAVDVTVNAYASEAVETAFNILDALGTEIDSLRKSPADPARVTGFFDEAPPHGSVNDAVLDSLRIHGHSAADLLSIDQRMVEETDWLAEWKKHWRPTDIGPFVIAPPWETDLTSDKIVIRIEPNMAFGTGTHETTQLCLEAIGNHFLPTYSLLDVGTGTGILAIAAAKLGGREIAAFDTDADSVRIARENAELNGVGEQIRFYEGSVDHSTPGADFVCANLTLDVIVPILSLLIDESRRFLVLSGILVQQRAEISGELERRGIMNFEIAIRGEWLSVVIANP